MKILIVDDEKVQRDLLKGFLERKGYEIFTAGNGHEALDIFHNHPISLVLTDHKMPGMTGDQLLKTMRGINPLARTVMITAYGTVDMAVDVMKAGADDFLEKPVDLILLLEKIQRLEQATMIQQEAQELQDNMDTKVLPVSIIGDSPPMREVLSLASRMAPTEFTALIRGETGTGKELIAQLIHHLSDRNEKPFVEVNCAAIPEHLFESELFGHEKGAFTGALNQRRGRFELAHEGTLFLDEVGELPLNMQVKLLKALQENRITRVGSEKDQQVDVRVVAATNRDLRQMVHDGEFREDLYFRLNVLEMELPPLRSRRTDIPLLIEYFLKKFSRKSFSFDPEAQNTLIKYSFPGNIRELEHIVQRVITLCRSLIIQKSDLPPQVRFYNAAEKGTLAEKLDSLEKELILTALSHQQWVQTRAAEELGISERVLRYKIDKHGLKKKYRISPLNESR